MVFGEFQWVELIYGFFGSFFGLLLALFTDNLIDKREEKRKINTVLEAIHTELKDTVGLIDDEDGEIMLISTFVWKSVTSSDFFSTILHEETEKCSLILRIYSGIDALMNLQEKYPTLVKERAAVIESILENFNQFDRIMKNKK